MVDFVVCFCFGFFFVWWVLGGFSWFLLVFCLFFLKRALANRENDFSFSWRLYMVIYSSSWEKVLCPEEVSLKSSS